MVQLYRLPRELHRAIFERKNFEFLQGIVSALAQLYATKELLDASQITANPQERLDILVKHFGKIWDGIAPQYLFTDSETVAANKVLVSTNSVAIDPLAIEISKEYVQALQWYLHIAGQLEQSRYLKTKACATWVFKPFVPKGSVTIKDFLLGFTALGYLSLVLWILPQVPEKDKLNWLTEACFLAMAYGQDKLAKRLIEEGVEVSASGHAGQTLLHWACEYGLLDAAKILLTKGANIQAQDNAGQIPLHWACYCGHQDVVRWLLMQATLIKVPDHQGRTPLEYARDAGHLEIVQMLMTHEERYLSQA